VAVAGLIKDLEGRPTGVAAEADASFHALREYQDGDDLRAIHWRSSARLGQIVVRQSEDTRRAQMVLVIGTTDREYRAGADFELAVSAYTSIGLGQLAESGGLSVVAASAMLPLAKASRGALLDQAARVGLAAAGARGHSLAEAAAVSRREAPGATLAVLVTGLRLSEPDLTRIARFLPRQATALALRCEAGADLALRRIGRLCLATIGRLDDLPKVLHRWGRRP
jgi:uncharacterized protein (DUF58 family)